MSKPALGDRTIEQIREHYLVERELADRLRTAPKQDRARLYGQVYNELFQRVPNHPQLLQPSGRADRETADKMILVRRFLRPETVFLEIGAGDCELSIEVAKRVRTSYALEVSEEIVRNVHGPENFKLLLSSGTEIPLAPETVSVAYSYQVMEHIHPDDATEQLGNIHRALVPGGRYICVTPSRLCGPHDVSKYFDKEARGFHLKEYSLTEVAVLMRGAGFTDIRACVGAGGHFLELRIGVVMVIEKALERFPYRLRKFIAELPILKNILLAPVVGQKRATRQAIA